VQGLTKGEGEKSEANRESIDLQARRLPVQVRAMREAEEREGKASLLNLPGSPEAEHQLPLSKAKENRSGERKRARGLHRQGHNKYC
jgi:hypothetical protein